MASGQAVSRQFFFLLRSNDIFMKFIEGFKSTEYSVAEEMSISRSVKVRGTAV